MCDRVCNECLLKQAVTAVFLISDNVLNSGLRPGSTRHSGRHFIGNEPVGNFTVAVAVNKVLVYSPNQISLILHNGHDTFFLPEAVHSVIAITYRDEGEAFGKIGTFTAFPELNGIVNKAAVSDEAYSVASIVYTQVRFDLDALYAHYSEYKSIIGSNGRDKRFRNNAFDKIKIFTDTPKGTDDIKVLGILKNKRTWKYIPLKYVDMSHENIDKWKVLVPRANGSGALGEVLSTPLIGEQLIGYTQSFIGIGSFDTEFEAAAVMKYIKSKFARVILGVLKVTQDNDRGVWKLIPLQDFTPASDIDWSKSIHEIDLQLYRKYGLDEKEIAFIESHVKEMA